MSCFMLGERSLTVIAKYLAAAANAKGPGTMLVGIAKACTPEKMDDVLRSEGCYNVNRDMCDERKVYGLLARMNAESVGARYGDYPAIRAMDDEVTVDTDERTRRVWLAKLFRICQCYLYQIDEAEISCKPFFKAFEAWTVKMAALLADYLVDEAYGGKAPWGEF